jgi:MoaA/NifB/PqqE/SkfB family radical SAM enzyme
VNKNKLESIGFYTLEDNRAKNTSIYSPLWRNELIITSRCNFNCPYCRGTTINENYTDMSLHDIKHIIRLWASNNVQNVRFSGGEPTLHKDIIEIIKYTKSTCKNIKHIAISTNGYNDINLYKKLTECGVNDFSISLDACCSSTGDMMAGNIKGSWNKVIQNIKEISKLTYTTVGMVFNQQNSNSIKESIIFAHNLGVHDIRIITAAQYNNFSVFENLNIDEYILNQHPILKYRINNFKNNRNVRGISESDNHNCPLMLDDTIIKGNYHYPCVIHMREYGKPISNIKNKSMLDIRKERLSFYNNHNCFNDHICKNNCLDVCIDYNNKYKEFNK